MGDKPDFLSWGSDEDNEPTLPKRALDPDADGGAPPAASPGDGPDHQPHHALDPEPQFSRTVLFTIAGTAVPGLGLIAAKRRVIGWTVLGLFVTGLLTVGIWALVDRQGLIALGVNPTFLRALAVALVVIAVVWVGVVVASHLSLRGKVTRSQRIGGGILVGVLAFAVAAPMAIAAHTSYLSAGAVDAIFKSDKDSKSATRPTLANPTKKGDAPDPWADKPRLNILLLGGDDGPGRDGTRTDTVILASINTATGDTTLFSLPRNTAQMPFPSDSPLSRYYPNGFTDGNSQNAEYFLNAMYRNVPNVVPKDVLGATDNLGADVLKVSVGEALGLKVDYYVLINLQGFTKLVNALGGITVNINTYVPMGGNSDLHIPPKEYLKPGPDQHLTGREALWFARGRYGSDDYVRMGRQRCVIGAIIDQANPANVLARYEDIVKAGTEIVQTDLPREVLPLIVDLSLRVKNGNVRSVVFAPGPSGWVSGNPNWTQVRRQVKSALNETKVVKPATSTSANPSKSPSSSGGDDEKTSDDVADSCAYQPKVAATAEPPR